MLGKLKGKEVEHLGNLAKLTLSCVISELKSLDDCMKNKTEQNTQTIEMKSLLSAIKKFKQAFSLPDYKQVEKKLIDDCCKHFAKILYIDLHLRLLGILELEEYHWDKAKYLSGSFIVVFDEIYHDWKDQKYCEYL